MKIQKFSFSHYRENWHIDEVSFDDFNLLVGPSGVGKTRILKALELIFQVVDDGNTKLDNIEWKIYFFHLGERYRWKLKSHSSKSTSIFESLRTKTPQIASCEIIFEELVKYALDSEVTIFSRTPSKNKFNGKDIPPLRRTESFLFAFSEDESILSVNQAFKKLVFNEISQKDTNNISVDDFEMICSHNIIDWQYQESKETWGTASPIEKGFLLQELDNEIFQSLKTQYSNIFPGVQDIRIGNQKIGINQYTLFFEIKEEDLEEWIPQSQISSGMFRTLIYIIEVITAPEGSVMLIDEFENSLGMNCMAELTDFILDHAEGIQFIITSHHPYIINNIPWQDWQIVSRKGNHIRTTKATDIPDLDTASSLDKFTQLINVLEFEDIAA